MRTKLLSVIAVVFVLTVVLTSCKKDDDGTTSFQGDEFGSLSFNEDEIISKVPDGLKNSTDPNAASCLSVIESAIDMSTFVDNMTPPESATVVSTKSTEVNTTYTWSWAYQGQSFTFFWTYREDAAKYYWDMQIQLGTNPAMDYISAWEMKDGSQGGIEYNFNWVCLMNESYTSECMDYYWTYSWSEASDGTWTLGWVAESGQGTEGSAISYEVIINPDGSGSAEYYIGGALYYDYLWDALGNGSWAWYVGGSEYASGTWTV